MAKRKKSSRKKVDANIELGSSPANGEDSLDTLIGEEEKVARSRKKAGLGELEFICCDNSFIDHDDCSHTTTREEFFFPSTDEVVFDGHGQGRIYRPHLIEQMNSDSGFESVIGNDDRVRIVNTLGPQFPYSRRICSLIVTTRTNERLRGTGWIADNRLVMTAGHNLYIHQRLGWARSVTVIPGRNSTIAPFGSFTVDARSLFITKGWKERREISSDMGAITIPKDYSEEFSSRIGYFEIRALSDAQITRSRANIVGYPVDVIPVGSQWWHGRRILPNPQPRTIRYNIDTSPGQSGSAVYIKEGNTRYVVGIHNFDFGQFNQAVRINFDVLQKIREWKRIANAQP